MQPMSANQQNEEKKPFGMRQDQQLLLEKAHSRQDRCSLSAKWEPASFFYHTLEILENLEPHRWGRGQRRAGCR